ncbi:MAG TPA: M56 family metallopeptidase [Pirellulales bacterium]|jgi:beta-lactamase regulating signal transducer with metallopeptidase domain
MIGAALDSWVIARTSIGAVLTVISILLAIGIGVQFTGRRSAAWRHAILFWTLVAVGCCPMFAIVLPRFDIAPVNRAAMLPSEIVAVQPTASSETVSQRVNGPSQPNDLSASFFVAMWMIGAVVGSLRIGHGWRTMRRLMVSAVPMSSECAETIFSRTSEILGRPAPPVLVSAEVSVPMAVGLVRPRVLIPRSLVNRLPADQLLLVIVHESAHAIRRDPLIGLYQRWVAACLWFHPLVYVANRLMDTAREELCDTYALRLGSPADFARMLLTIAETIGDQRDVLLATPMLRSKNRLEQRITNLLKPGRRTMIRLRCGKSIMIATTFLLGACLLTTFATPPAARALVNEPEPLLGQAEEKDADPAATPGAGYDLSHRVDFQVGATQLLEGDNLTVDEVFGTSDKIEKGNLYVVKGTYRLLSHDSAQLAAYVTTSSKSAFRSTPTQKTQSIMIDKGKGKFSLIFYMWDDGWPHLSYYPASGGESFSAIYFGTGESLLTRGWWEKGDAAGRK